jgi:hypothetical protein
MNFQFVTELEFTKEEKYFDSYSAARPVTGTQMFPAFLAVKKVILVANKCVLFDRYVLWSVQ